MSQDQDEMTLAYQRARMEWDERIGDTVSQLKNWRIVAIIALCIATFSVIGIGYIGAQSKIEPYAIAISDNQAIALEKLKNLPQTQNELLVRAQLREFITNVRSVYSDPFAQRRATRNAFAHLRTNDAAHTQLYNYLGKIAAPNKRAENELVSVQVSSVLPLGQGNTYQIQWTEKIIDRKGVLQSTPKFRAVITVEFKTPTTEQSFATNPTGLWVTTYQVTELN